jgi:hypothetical protein
MRCRIFIFSKVQTVPELRILDPSSLQSDGEREGWEIGDVVRSTVGSSSLAHGLGEIKKKKKNTE